MEALFRDDWNEKLVCLGFPGFFKRGRTNASGQKGIATFYVMRCLKKKDLATPSVQKGSCAQGFQRASVAKEQVKKILRVRKQGRD